MCFKILEWDSDFFGFLTARITLPLQEHEKIPEVVSRMKIHGIKLAYWMIPGPWPRLYTLPECRRVALADIKMTYSMKLEEKGEPIPSREESGIEEYEPGIPEPEMYRLARLSGHCSRFKMDPMVPPDSFTRLYDTWLERSVNHQLALAVYVRRNHGRPVGMVTLESHPPVSRIGLIAVDPDHQGQGIAKALIRQCQQRSCREKFRELKVSTQHDNLQACRLYTRFGFELVDTEYVYHFWLD